MSHILTSGTLGTNDNLPSHVREIARLRSQVLAWTALDPRLTPGEIEAFACCSRICLLIVVPCFWPAMLWLLPCIYCNVRTLKNDILNSYWILTKSDLNVLTTHFVVSIPLESIKTCGTKMNREICCINCFVKPLPSLYVDTITFTWMEDGPLHSAEGFGLANQDLFRSEILKRRDIVKRDCMKNNLSPRKEIMTPMSRALIATPAMERGSAKSAADCMEDVTNLRTSGRTSQT